MCVRVPCRAVQETSVGQHTNYTKHRQTDRQTSTPIHLPTHRHTPPSVNPRDTHKTQTDRYEGTYYLPCPPRPFSATPHAVRPFTFPAQPRACLLAHHEEKKEGVSENGERDDHHVFCVLMRFERIEGGGVQMDGVCMRGAQHDVRTRQAAVHVNIDIHIYTYMYVYVCPLTRASIPALSSARQASVFPASAAMCRAVAPSLSRVFACMYV